jgi:hypothetical protein
MPMSQQNQPSDLTAGIFQILRTAFFRDTGEPRTYQLRDKRNTQDDPFDEYVHKILTELLPIGTVSVKAPGPLITPDLVIMRPDICHGVSRALRASDLTRIVGIEVRKLERTLLGRVARASGMDYNTTPPCGTVRVYDQQGYAIDIRGCYLFVCQEPVGSLDGFERGNNAWYAGYQPTSQSRCGLTTSAGGAGAWTRLSRHWFDAGHRSRKASWCRKGG